MITFLKKIFIGMIGTKIVKLVGKILAKKAVKIFIEVIVADFKKKGGEKMANPKYSIAKTLWKGIKSVIVFALPVVITYLGALGIGNDKILDIIVSGITPIIGSITVGGALTMLLNWIKNK